MATKKDSDEKRVDEISGKFQEINSINISGGKIENVVFEKGIVQNDLDLFIQALHAISKRHSEKRPRLIQFLYQVFKRRETEKISNILALKDLIQILTRKDFYQTTGREKQEKYIGIMLNYLERELPADYGFLLSRFLFLDVAVENQHQIDVVTRLLVQRLAGDISTDAPPPEKKEKSKGK